MRLANFQTAIEPPRCASVKAQKEIFKNVKPFIESIDIGVSSGSPRRIIYIDTVYMSYNCVHAFMVCI